MNSHPWIPVLVKALATALVVTLSSVVAESAGPVWGALAASLPVSAGPAYILLALQHDSAFVAASALGGAAANAATIAFLAVYACLAAPSRRSGSRAWSRAGLLGAATAVWVVLALMIQHVAWSAAGVLLLNGAALGLALRLIRERDPSAAAHAPVDVRKAEPPRRVRRRWFDLPLRATVVTLFVAAVVVGSAALGPAATGTAASFPIVFTVVLFMLHSRMGAAARALLAVTALRAMGGFALMLLVVHQAVVPWGAPLALLLALLTTLAWSTGLLLLRPHVAVGQ